MARLDRGGEGAAGGVGLRRFRVLVRGRVQGVGFRPTVHRVASALGLAGFVANDGAGVTIEIEGAAADRFAEALRANAPPLARIETLEAIEIAATGHDKGFAIVESRAEGAGARLAPDVAVCRRCLDEMFDPADRRHLHPFIACTDCGPRFSMTRSLPYDRARTTMGAFAMCPACAAEYADPASRRFHAEPIACPACGPKLSHSVEAMVAVLARGGIVALKGIGGYHLIVDARDEAAVAELRRRKKREAKPFAVMVPGRAAIDAFVRADAAEHATLASPERPILILPARAGTAIAPSVAMGLPSLGLFLPTTPAHAALFHARAGSPAGSAFLDTHVDALVVTSANVAGDPIVVDDAEARERLADIADLIVAHDREILVRADDSVARMIAGAPALLRRSRGHAAEPVRLPRVVPPVGAVGAYLKTTVGLAEGAFATLSAHVGDLDGPRAIEAHAAAFAHLAGLTGIAPRAIAHDLHPDFPSIRFAEATGLPTVPVQHHHAHALAVAAEHGVERPFLALILDGVGHGPDGGIWGGELLGVDGLDFERVGHLAPIPLPGGDRAAREPWRVAAGLLHRFGRGDEIARRFPNEPRAGELARLLPRMAAPETTSAGRLFDAAAALAGIATHNRFEAEAAQRLEAAVTRPDVMRDGFSLRDRTLDVEPLMRALADGADPAKAANLFHGTFAAGLVALVARAASASGLTTIALAGGCLANRVLAEALMDGLAAEGLEPLLPRAVPANDGGLALGQLWAAALAVERGRV